MTEAPPIAGAPRGPNPAQAVRNKDIGQIWTDVVEMLRKDQKSPGDVWVRLKRIDMGPNRTIGEAIVDLMPIDGYQIAGGPETSPGQELVNYVTEVYHLAGSAGPAKYIFDITYKSGQSGRFPAPQGELVLGDPKGIIRQREAARMMAQRRRVEEPQQGAYIPQGMPSSRGMGGMGGGCRDPTGMRTGGGGGGQRSAGVGPVYMPRPRCLCRRLGLRPSCRRCSRRRRTT